MWAVLGDPLGVLWGSRGVRGALGGSGGGPREVLEGPEGALGKGHFLFFGG